MGRRFDRPRMVTPKRREPVGTDVHMYVEKRVDGVWSVVAPPERDLEKYPRGQTITRRDGSTFVDDGPFWGPSKCMYECKCYGERAQEKDCVGADCPACLGTLRDMRWYHNRNYDVFAILADVRNGHGFAGVATGNGFNVIAEPRGIPDDLSPMVRDHSSWDHTPSWLLLAEILAFDWTQVTGHTGVIPLFKAEGSDRLMDGDANYVDWKEHGGGCPSSYSGSVSGKGIVTVSAAEADAMIASGSHRNHRAVYVQVSWSEVYSESASDFLAFVEEFLKPLGDPADVRIVFGFDS